MNIYLIKNLNLKIGKSLISGSFLGIVTSTCVSCSSIGFITISTFGGAGRVATAFLTNYQIPLRLLSIGIMIGSGFLIGIYIVSRTIGIPQIGIERVGPFDLITNLF